MTDTSPSTAFAGALSRAVSEGSLTLQQLSQRLGELGTPLSAATLSYWCSGRSVPARARSRQAVTHLERLLDLVPGHLVSSLPGALNARWNPSVGVADLKAVQLAVAGMGMDLDRHLEARVITDELTVSEDGQRMQLTTHQLHWADAKKVSRFPVLMSLPHPNARLESASVEAGAHLGSHQILPAAGVLAMEVRLDHELRRGDLGQIRYEVSWACDEPITQYTRRLPIVLGRLALAVAFEGDPPRTVVHAHLAQHGTASRTELPAGPQVQTCIAEAAAGIHRLEW